jgi:hypothetical protein
LRSLSGVVLTGALLSPSVAYSQLPPIAEGTLQYLPASEVPGSGGLSAQVASYDAALNVPFVLGEKAFLVPGLQYHVDSVSYTDEPAGFTELNAFHSVDVPVLYVHLLPKKWALSLRVWPGVAGDFDAFDSGLFRVGALAMATWAPSDELVLGAGGVASYAFGQLLPLPTVYVDWKPAPWFRVESSLPFFASALFTVNERWEFGLQGDVNGNEYAIRRGDVRNRYPCKAAEADDPTTGENELLSDPENCLDHLAYSVVAAGIVARFRVVSSFWVAGFFGRTLYRRYDLKNAEGDAIPGGQVELPNELALRVGLVMRIPFPEEGEGAAP